MYSILLVFAAVITTQLSPLFPVRNLTPRIALGVDCISIVQNESSRGSARVEGIVRERFQRHEPVPNALVRLFPDPPSPEHPDLIRSARTDERGNFVIEGVVPGRYRAIAIMGAGPENLHDEATIATAAGTRIELSENQSRTLTLYLYPAHR